MRTPACSTAWQDSDAVEEWELRDRDLQGQRSLEETQLYVQPVGGDSPWFALNRAIPAPGHWSCRHRKRLPRTRWDGGRPANNISYIMKVGHLSPSG